MQLRLSVFGRFVGWWLGGRVVRYSRVKGGRRDNGAGERGMAALEADIRCLPATELREWEAQGKAELGRHACGVVCSGERDGDRIRDVRWSSNGM